MCQKVALAVDSPMRTFGLPLWLLSIAAFIIEGICKPLRIQPPLHQRRLDFFRKSFFFDTTLSHEILGADSFLPFSDGAMATAKWYRENGLLED